MIKVGIDVICFYTSHYYLDLAVLAEARKVEADKYHVGLGQKKMAVPAPDEDIVTMAANAAKQVLKQVNPQDIDSLLFATESAFDQSKSAGTYVHHMLGLKTHCRVVELKQACYGATAALQLGLAMIARQPSKKILLVASDIARYGLNTTGESSQGCGAVAMVLSANPRILAIEPGSGLYTDDVMDFWRPNYHDAALVEGKYSALVYMRALEECWKHFQAETKRDFKDMDYVCYHVPVPRLVEKAHKILLKINGLAELSDEVVTQQVADSLTYAREIGNSYTAALYVSLISLLENNKEDLSNKRIGLYSYGSGCMAEFFTGVVQPTYREMMHKAFHQKLLKSRKALSYDEYAAFYNFRLPEDGTECHTPHNQTGDFRLAGIKKHQRQYEKIEAKKKPAASSVVDLDFLVVKARAPGKLILSGEHSILYDCPALGMAIDRYVEATVSPHFTKMISFNLFSSRYRDSFTLQTLREVKDRLVQKYQQFTDGKSSIREVLQTPFELMQFAFINLFDHVNSKILNGLEIQMHSTIPIGCGMGSSAASILSVQKAVSQYCRFHLKNERLFRFGIDAERLQHGKTSGMDLQISIHGGCLYMFDGQIQEREVPAFPLCIVNTGTPMVSTGECVEYVRDHFGNSPLWATFRRVTDQMDQALREKDFSAFQQAVRENHRLLVKIGIVPEKVRRFIEELESVGAAAKVCGAGAIEGDAAGIVLIVFQDTQALQSICDRYHYAIEEIHGEKQGAHII